MTRSEILLAMADKQPRHLFKTMQLGGSASVLRKMEDEGLLKSQRRYLGGDRQRDWYLTEEQHHALSFLMAD